jgi:DNA-directed RNA polymerase specialized sigma24 family protein
VATVSDQSLKGLEVITNNLKPRMINQWINQNYPKLQQAAKNITKSSEWEDVLSYSLEIFLLHEKRDQIIKDGGAMFWIVRTMMNSYRSHTSAYHTLHRQKNKNISLTYFDTPDLSGEAEELEELIQQIEALLEEGLESRDPATWYRVKLLKLYVETPNYSKLARQIGIPRTSISQAVQEARQWVLSRLQS